MGLYSTLPWRRIWTNFSLANWVLHVVFSHRLSRKQNFKGFPHFFRREWMASPAGGGATGVLHDFDRPSGCKKKKNATKRKWRILHNFIGSCLSRSTKITYQTDVSCSNRKNNETAVCNESLFTIFSSEQRKTFTWRWLHIKTGRSGSFACKDAKSVIRWYLIKHDPGLNTIRDTSSVANDPRYLWKVFRWKKSLLSCFSRCLFLIFKQSHIYQNWNKKRKKKPNKQT